MAHIGTASPFEFTAGELCLDFANTVSNRSDPVRVVDHLDRIHRTSAREDGAGARGRQGGYAALLEWSGQAGTVAAAERAALAREAGRRPRAAKRALGRARELREAIYTVMSARAAGRGVPRDPLAVIEREAAAAAAHRRLAGGREGEAVEWTWDTAGSRLDRPLWPVALSAADTLTRPDRVALVRECALETCGWLFVDTSRNRSRRWCDMRVCGNRAKARRFYERSRP